MYCNQCGTQLSDGASFCHNCGKAIKTSSKPPIAPKSGNQKQGLSKKHIAIIAAVALAICIVIAIAAFAISGVTDDQKTIAVPTIERVEKMVNSIGNGEITFAVENSKYGYDIHRVIYNKTDVGNIFLHAKSEDIGLYIEKDSSDSEEAFSQMAAGIMLACDPSLNLDKAKELLNAAVAKPKSDDVIWNNNVSYDVFITDDRYILRVKNIPDEATS